MLNKPFAPTFSPQLLASALFIGSIVLGLQKNAQALTFNFNFAQGTPIDIMDEVEEAGEFWEEVFRDDVTVNIDFEYGELPDGYLGGARPNMLRVDYGDAVKQFGLDSVSNDDHNAVKNLPTYRNRQGNMSISRRINLTNQDQKTNLPQTYHTDTSISNLWLTRANAKALGIVKGDDGAADATIRLNSDVTWDLHARNGIRSGRYDFVGTMVHELGHTMGFLSGVDIQDIYHRQNQQARKKTYLTDADYDYVTAMDLFRQSSKTKDRGQIDWTVVPSSNLNGNDPAYFSVDGGKTKIANFTERETPRTEEDFYQLSHFSINEASVMAPVLYSGTRVSELSEIDIRLMDVIGWDLSSKSKTNYRSSIAHTNDIDGFDSPLTWGNARVYNRHFYTQFWQEGSFLASIAGGPAEPQDVPEPGSILGLGAIALLGLKSLKKRP